MPAGHHHAHLRGGGRGLRQQHPGGPRRARVAQVAYPRRLPHGPLCLRAGCRRAGSGRMPARRRSFREAADGQSADGSGSLQPPYSSSRASRRFLSPGLTCLECKPESTDIAVATRPAGAILLSTGATHLRCSAPCACHGLLTCLAARDRSQCQVDSGCVEVLSVLSFALSSTSASCWSGFCFGALGLIGLHLRFDLSGLRLDPFLLAFR